MPFLSDIVPFLPERKAGFLLFFIVLLFPFCLHIWRNIEIDTMQFLQSFVLALLFSCEALSAPTPTTTRSRLQGRSFKIGRVRQGATVLDGATALQRSYRKYGIAAVDLGIDDLLDFKPLSSGNSQTSTDDDQTGEVSAVSVQGDAQFVSPVTIGGQTIVMNFDTGSADL